jgi:spore germination cell wall hydrolase CwlJ-like protein
MRRTILASIAAMLLLTFGCLKTSNTHHEQSTQRQSLVTYDDLSQVDKREVDCLADNIYFEARSQSEIGQRAVALVTMNRVSSGTFPNTVCGVVKQKIANTCQFSWWCNAATRARSIERRFDDADSYQQAREVAFDVYINYSSMYDITRGALFYHSDSVSQSALGIRRLKFTVKIDQHSFYGV